MQKEVALKDSIRQGPQPEGKLGFKWGQLCGIVSADIVYIIGGNIEEYSIVQISMKIMCYDSFFLSFLPSFFLSFLVIYFVDFLH